LLAAIDMKYLTTLTPPEVQVSDCLIIPILAHKSLSHTGKLLDIATQGQLSRIVHADLVSTLGKVILLYEPNQLPAKRILAISCGDNQTLSGLQFQRLIAHAVDVLKSQDIRSVCCYLEDFPTENDAFEWKVCLAIQQFEASVYTFEKFKTKAGHHTALASVYFYLNKQIETHNIEYALQKGLAIAQGMTLNKDLANTPANHATPTDIGIYAKQLAQTDPYLQVDVYDKTHDTIKDMGAFLGVAKGSDEPAQFIVIQYTPPAPTEQSPIVLVGKGVTFDAGGISIKPAADMGEMKFDMTGAASVLGTLKAVAQLKVPIPVIGLLPLTENLLNGSALKPGDVIKTLSGQTVEVIDTDAEGRLILADALTYSRRFNPAIVIDIATLTGAVVTALGEMTTALMTEDILLRAALEKAGETSVDRVWALPLWEEYHELINSNVADMSNLGHRGAGAITAGCFLARFTEGLCWAHLDITGTAYKPGRNKTATGRPVPLLVQYILDYCNSLTE
jgi:leucyl aminopeptidase